MKVTALPIDPGPAAWNTILPRADRYPPLRGDVTCDYFVVGAGFAGLSAARRLAQLQPGASIVVVDATRVEEDAFEGSPEPRCHWLLRSILLRSSRCFTLETPWTFPHKSVLLRCPVSLPRSLSSFGENQIINP